MRLDHVRVVQVWTQSADEADGREKTGRFGFRVTSAVHEAAAEAAIGLGVLDPRDRRQWNRLFTFQGVAPGGSVGDSLVDGEDHILEEVHSADGSDGVPR